MCCSKSFRATLICDVLPELSTRKVTWYFKSCRHYNTGSTVRPHLYDTWLALFVKCIFLIKKGKKDIFIPFIRPPCNIYSSPPPKKPYPSPVLTALALNTEAQSIDILLIIIVTPRQWDSFPECETEMCLSDLLILTGTTNSQIKCFNLPSLGCLTVFYGST